MFIMDDIEWLVIDEDERIRDDDGIFQYMFKYPIFDSDHLRRSEIHIDILIALQWRFFEIGSDKLDIFESEEPIG